MSSSWFRKKMNLIRRSMQDAPQKDPRKLFVGNLSFDTTEDTLKNIFAEYGDVEEAVLIKDRMSGRSRGIAFVTFVTVEAAEAAIAGLDGQEVDGRAIVVKVSEPKPKRSGGFNNRRGGGQYDRKPNFNRDRNRQY